MAVIFLDWNLYPARIARDVRSMKPRSSLIYSADTNE